MSHDLTVGESIKLDFDTSNHWWRVRAVDERYAIATRQALFQPAGVVVYTILDFDERHRGPCDLVGQGWDFNEETLDADAARLLDALHDSYEITDRIRTGESGVELADPAVQISRRNRVPLSILNRREATK